MYQLTFSVGNNHENWFFAVENQLKAALDNLAIMVTRSEKTRLFVAIACENQHKRRVKDAVRSVLVDMFATEAKRYYYRQNLALPLLSQDKFNILLAALVEFDSNSDKQLIAQTLTLESGLNIDGVYNFAFADIKNRWRDIGELTSENALYLSDNEIFFELIRYMFSAITPKIDSVSLSFDGEKYFLTDGKAGDVIGEAKSEHELFCKLISVAPVTLVFSGEDISHDLRKQLDTLFGVSSRSQHFPS